MTFSRKRRQFLIAFVDAALISAAVFLSLWIRDMGVPSLDRFWQHFLYFIPIIAAWIVCLYTAGFYSLEAPYTGYRALSQIVIIAAVCTLFGFAFFYLNLNARLLPKTILAIHSFVAATLIILWRLIFSKIVARYSATINIAFVGMNDTIAELLRNMRNFSYMNYKTMFLYAEGSRGHQAEGIPVINDPALFIEEIKRNRIQIVVVADKKNMSDVTQNVLFELLRNQIYFIDLPDFYEMFMRRIPLDAVNELWFLTSIDLRSKKIYSLFKRMADMVMACVFLLVTIPFWPFIILLIKLESSGPAFFKQTRVGYLEKPFAIIKFRTMRVDGNAHQPTEQDDLRVTSVGKFLRKTRIDEIPQFLNIIKSDMSFFGPRPERPELMQELERDIPFYRQRLLVKPGISGWDQVSGEYHSPSREDTYKKLQYDLYYIKNMSFFLDVSIFFKTLVTMVRRAGV